MKKRYATPHRSRVVKTRMTEEEYADFTGRLAACEMSQSEFIRQAITKATGLYTLAFCPRARAIKRLRLRRAIGSKTSLYYIITVSPVNDELLAAVGKLTAEYGKIGGNLNQIARYLNEYHNPYYALAKELRDAAADRTTRLNLFEDERSGVYDREVRKASFNASFAAEGKPTTPTKFETDKEKLRQAICAALSSATSFEDFAALLLREGVTVKLQAGFVAARLPSRYRTVSVVSQTKPRVH